MSASRVVRWVVASAAVLVTVLSGVAAGAVPTPTHARLNGSTPAAGSVLPQAPTTVVLAFNRDIAPPATVVVTAPGGDRVGSGEPTVQGREVSTPVAARQEGTYAVAFRAVSVDGHPITGRFTFSVGHRSSPPDTTHAPPSGRSPWVAGLAGLVAAVAFVGWWRRRGARPPRSSGRDVRTR